MSLGERDDLRKNLAVCNEMALTLLYADGSTQLRDIPHSKVG